MTLTMRRSRWLIAVVLALMPLASCTQGDECDRCETDEDCQEGFLCSDFSDGSRRCGTGVGGSTCRVR
jgi:hypothetical protein